MILARAAAAGSIKSAVVVLAKMARRQTCPNVGRWPVPRSSNGLDSNCPKPPRMQVDSGKARQPVGAAAVRDQQRRNRMPTVTAEKTRCAMVSRDDQDGGLQIDHAGSMASSSSMR